MVDNILISIILGVLLIRRVGVCDWMMICGPHMCKTKIGNNDLFCLGFVSRSKDVGNEDLFCLEFVSRSTDLSYMGWPQLYIGMNNNMVLTPH